MIPLFTLATIINALPVRNFILADAGYVLSKRVLTPFRATRYHLKEFGATSEKPGTAKELFNLRHSKMRNVVERTIGVWWRFLRYENESLDFAFVSRELAVVIPDSLILF